MNLLKVLLFYTQENALEEEFDPEAHDLAMSRMFGDDYYTQDEGSNEKPAFEYEDDVDVISKSFSKCILINEWGMDEWVHYTTLAWDYRSKNLYWCCICMH